MRSQGRSLLSRRRRGNSRDLGRSWERKLFFKPAIIGVIMFAGFRLLAIMLISLCLWTRVDVWSTESWTAKPLSVSTAAAPELMPMSAQSSEATSSGSSFDAWLNTLGFVYDPVLGRVRSPFDFLHAEDDPAIQESFVSLLDPSILLRPLDLAVLTLPGAGKTGLRLMAEHQAARMRRGDISLEEDLVQQSQDRRGVLRRILIERFNGSELQDLCFELDVNYDTLLGETKADKARELISFLERRERLADMERVGRRLRSEIPWDTIFLPPGFTSEFKLYTSPLSLAVDLEDILRRDEAREQVSARTATSILLDYAESQEGSAAELAVHSILQRVPRREFHRRNIYFKMLLPLQFKPFTQDFQAFAIDWPPASLQSLITSRILWASNGTLVATSADLVESLLVRIDPDEVLARISITPRRLLQIGQLLLASQRIVWGSSRHAHDAKVEGDRISWGLWQQCIKQIGEMTFEFAP